MRLVKILCLLLCAGLLTGLPAAAESAPQDVRTLLEAAGYYVQSGSLYELDTLEEASQGRLLSCFGNNAGSTYMVLDLPPAPNQEPAKGVAQLNWPDEEPSEYYDETADNASANPYFMPVGWQYKLRQDEAIVLMGQMPPACKYYSFVNYILFTEEKAELCAILNRTNPYNRRFGWTTIKSMLIDCDYTISEGRKNNRRYAIISPPQ